MNFCHSDTHFSRYLASWIVSVDFFASFNMHNTTFTRLYASISLYFAIQMKFILATSIATLTQYQLCVWIYCIRFIHGRSAVTIALFELELFEFFEWILTEIHRNNRIFKTFYARNNQNVSNKSHFLKKNDENTNNR